MSNKPLRNVPEETIIFTERTENGSAPGPNQKTEPYLIQLSGRETGHNYILSAHSIRIGRDNGCEICVDDPHVSRTHALIESKDGHLTIRDLGSTNGISVNGNKVMEHVLVDGDKILVGTRLYFRFTFQDMHDQNYQQSLFRAANIDALTQLYNKRYFLDILPKEMSFTRRAHENLSLMMIDVDHFKNINDTYGHLAGDTVLKAIGNHLSKHVRFENVACRYGGEEFAVIIRNCNAKLAHAIADRLRLSMEATRIRLRDQEIQVTVSIGIATYVDDCFPTIEDFIQQADDFLYEAKNNGRNRTISTAHRAP